RNTVIRVTRYAWQVSTAARWEEDANQLTTSDQSRGLDYRGQHFTTDVAGYRARSGQGAHSQPVGNFTAAAAVDAAFVDAPNGDLAPKAGSGLVDNGVPVPNISDRPGVDFNGSGPDVGAIES